MAVTIQKKFHKGKDSYVRQSTSNFLDSDDLQRIVFTSTNMPDDMTAGTRSHTQPGGKYLGTWYESFDILHKASQDQEYPEFPRNCRECMYKTLTLLSGTLTVETGASGVFWHNYENVDEFQVEVDEWNYKINFIGKTWVYEDSEWKDYGKAYFHINKDVYGYIESYSFGTATLSGTTVNTVNLTFGEVTGSAVLTGTLASTPPTFPGIIIDPDAERRWGGDSIYNKTEDYRFILIDREDWYLNPLNAVVFELTFGEAYDCRLTAWDDDTHSTTNNKILDEGHYRVDAVSYRYEMDPYVWRNNVTYLHYKMTSPDCFVYPPVRDQVLKGNDYYYGDFDLVYAVSSHGECLIFKPRLFDMNDTFTAGNYDFVTTLHYQYT